MIVLPLIVGGVLGGAGVYAWARGRATLREDEFRRRLAAKPKALPPAGAEALCPPLCRRTSTDRRTRRP